MSRRSRYMFFQVTNKRLGNEVVCPSAFWAKGKESFGNPKKFKGCLDSEVSEVLLLSYFVSELGEPVPSLEEATRFNSSEEQQEQSTKQWD